MDQLPEKPVMRHVDEDRVIPPSTFAHVVIRTAKMEEMIRWYSLVLGAHVVFQSDFICFLTYDAEHHRIALLKASGESISNSSSLGVDHFAYSYRDLGELLATYERLSRHDILPVRTINHGPTISFYYRDPEHVKIELQVDNFETAEASTAFFHSEEFASNPIGVLVDPNELKRDWESGVPFNSIATRPPLPPGKTISDMQKES